MKLYLVLAHVSASYPNLTGRLPTWYSPIRRSFHKRPPEGFSLLPALDLHALGTPPAFVLSQDQTLHKSSKHMTDESRHMVILASTYFESCLTSEKHLHVSLYTGCSIQFSRSKSFDLMVEPSGIEPLT